MMVDPLVASDEALAAEARSGRREAFAALFRRYYAAVYSLCRKISAETEEAHDLAQEAFLRAFRAIGDYREDRPFAGWLLSIAAHLAIDWVRRRRRRGELEILPPESAEAPPLLAVDRERLLRTLGGLPPEYRAIVALHFQENFSHEEIAKALGISASLSRVRLHRAISALREELS